MPFLHDFFVLLTFSSKVLPDISIILKTLFLSDKGFTLLIFLLSFLIILFHHFLYLLRCILKANIFSFSHILCTFFNSSFSLFLRSLFSPHPFFLCSLFTLLLSLQHHFFNFGHSFFKTDTFFFSHILSTVLHTFFLLYCIPFCKNLFKFIWLISEVLTDICVFLNTLLFSNEC